MMSHATGLPLSPTFDDVDLGPQCLAPDGKPQPLAGEIGVEAFMELVFQTLLPHPASYQAVCDALRHWYRDFRPPPAPAPA